MDVSAAGSMEVVEHADAGGTHDEQVLRGDVHVVRERRERAAAHTRTRMAIQAELDKLVPSEVSAAIPAEALQKPNARRGCASGRRSSESRHLP